MDKDQTHIPENNKKKNILKENKATFILLSYIFITIFIVTLISRLQNRTFNIIDTHEHIEYYQQARKLSKANKANGIIKTVLVSSPIETLTLNGNPTFTGYKENMEQLLKINKVYPDQFIPFCTISPIDPNMLEYFKDCIKSGGKGLKLYNGHKHYYEIFNTRLDDPKMMELYAYVEEKNLPILFHINLKHYQDELENILSKYPNLTVSIPHFMVSTVNLTKVSSLLDKYPNIYTDISFGQLQFMASGFRRISNNISKFKKFTAKYSDRILFGADMVLTSKDTKYLDYIKSIQTCYKDILEKYIYKCDLIHNYYLIETNKYNYATKVCDKKEKEKKNLSYKEQKECKKAKYNLDIYTQYHEETKQLRGLNLSTKTLKKIYETNAQHFLSGNINKN